LRSAVLAKRRAREASGARAAVFICCRSTIRKKISAVESDADKLNFRVGIYFVLRRIAVPAICLRKIRDQFKCEPKLQRVNTRSELNVECSKKIGR